VGGRRGRRAGADTLVAVFGESDFSFLPERSPFSFSLCVSAGLAGLTAAAPGGAVWFAVWERVEARATAGELVAGTEHRLEVRPLSSAVSSCVPPPLSEARSLGLESRWASRCPGGGSGAPWPSKAKATGESVGVEGQRAAEAAEGAACSC
jgi:hypothetical protein